MDERLGLEARGFLFLGALFCTAACGSETAGPAPDLPRGWETASAIQDLHQTACNGLPYDGTPEAMTASTSERSIHVLYEPAHFRCAQALQGFVKSGKGSVDVLVQPIDMNPASVAKCDCLYGVDMKIPADSGEYAVSVYRRWDHKSGADGPLQIGSESVTVP
ncbi:MAG TPA: hypothetical protein VHE30_10795 [Polyangiaceae bacterium]|nr:hypothetical protein [Polyangiaceae bacterium]